MTKGVKRERFSLRRRVIGQLFTQKTCLQPVIHSEDLPSASYSLRRLAISQLFTQKTCHRLVIHSEDLPSASYSLRRLAIIQPASYSLRSLSISQLYTQKTCHQPVISQKTCHRLVIRSEDLLMYSTVGNHPKTCPSFHLDINLNAIKILQGERNLALLI